MVMTRVETAIIDADAHVLETDRTWDYLEPEDQKYRPVSITTPDGQRYWMINGRIGGLRFAALSEKQLEAKSEKTGRLINAPQAAVEVDDVALRLEGMDQLGVDIQVLHNSLWIEAVTDVPEIERALCHSWNRWMGDVQAQGQNRIFWTCVVPVFDTDAALEEMRWSKEHGAVAVCLRPFEGDLIITDPQFYPIFEEAVRLDMAIAVHIANGNADLTRLLKTRYNSTGGWAAFRIPTVTATMAVLSAPVTQDFPTLRWGIIEASASWVPWLCREIERRTGIPNTPESNPFVAHNMYVTAQYDDDIAYVTKAVGEHVLMIGTDFGHTDASSEYDALMKLRDSSEISDSVKRRMLTENPAKLYGLQSLVS
jgi:predicted TIM-barrel fold metal-dependent hydrolase